MRPTSTQTSLRRFHPPRLSLIMTMLTLPFSPLIPYNTVPLLFRLYPGGIIAINLTLDWLSIMAGQDGTTTFVITFCAG